MFAALDFSDGLRHTHSFIMFAKNNLLFRSPDMRASEMKKGQTVTIDDKLYAIVDYHHVKLGKGGAVYQTKLKSLTDGSIQNIRLRAEESIEEAYLDKRTYEYLYSSGDEHILMDCDNYDQISLDNEAFGDGPKYLKPNTRLQVSMYEGKPVVVTLPNTVDLEVTETAPEIKGATATIQSWVPELSWNLAGNLVWMNGN